MRIVDTIPHPRLKISVFSLDTRWTVKLEDGPVEQTYKFRKEDFNGVEAVKALFSPAKLKIIEQQLADMKQFMTDWRRPGADPEAHQEEFPEII